MYSKILLTGDRGRLGTEIKKHLDVVGCNFDITGKIPKGDYDLIIHAAAYTDVAKADDDKETCMRVNVHGTRNLLDTYKDIPFVFISTEYAHNPKGFYAQTKKMAEELVKEHQNHLIIRTLFKPNPFPFESAYDDQYTQGDYVDVIARLIVDKIKGWSGISELCYIGTGRKTMFELAQRTRPDVKPNKITNPIIPHDYE